MTKRPEDGRCSERRKSRESEKPEGTIAVPRASGEVQATSEAEQDTLRGVVQILVKTLTGKTTTFDGEGQ